MPPRLIVPRRIEVLDSHTEGEPTRVVLAGGPLLDLTDPLPLVDQLRTRHDGFRTGVLQEPRGSEVVVGALLYPAADPTCATGVLFFNDVGYLGMCGHGTIGVITTLAHLGRILPGIHAVETPVGIVHTELHTDGRVSVRNVPSYRYAQSVTVDVPGLGTVTGDIAWGGNWFFLVAEADTALGLELDLSNRARLTAVATDIRSALAAHGITGKDGGLIDHVELFAPPRDPQNHSRNFVLCPGASFDRSPCGTGTSAKLACLHADGKLPAGETWRQEGILGTVFTGSVEPHGDIVIPTITGRAWITAETTLLFDATDPFQAGISFA